MQKKRVALFEFPVIPGIPPLASAYIQIVAEQKICITEAFEFESHAIAVSSKNIVERVLKCEADVYGFSTYVWNSRLVRRIVDRLAVLRPNAHIILGGPQVMHSADSYLKPNLPRMVLCNGEGEYTFSAYLEALLDTTPDFSKVPGLSFWNGEVLETTPAVPRIRDLDLIPSPYLHGLIDPKKYTAALLETNRGCPFKCTYCYWGGATNAKVHKFGEDRILQEIDWLCENKFRYITFIDANFGILERDLHIAQHIVNCKKRTGFPLSVFINSSKNTPERVTAITKMWNEVGLIPAQPVSLQTMNPEALKAVDRANIKESAYLELQRTLSEIGLQSFIEMIWPLPGETLYSFKEGLDALCRMKADTFVVYPLMLINNVEMNDQREKYKLQTIEDPDANSEAEIVVSTIDVTFDEYMDGVNIACQLIVLYTFMVLRHTMDYLDKAGVSSYSKVASDFWLFCQTRKDHPYTKYIENILAERRHNGVSGVDVGGAIHIALHSASMAFDQLLYDFCESQGWLAVSGSRLAFELDLLNRPLLYSNSRHPDRSSMMKMIVVEEIQADSLTAIIDFRNIEAVTRTLELGANAEKHSENDNNSRLSVHYGNNSRIECTPSVPDWYFHSHCQGLARGQTRLIKPHWDWAGQVALL